jgi:hypothetical protein
MGDKAVHIVNKAVHTGKGCTHEAVHNVVAQNGAGPSNASPKEEARQWIENWRQKQKQLA